MADFFQKLKRRHVIRAGFIYTICTWILVEVLSITLPTLLASGWVVRALGILFLPGLAATLVLAWVYTWTPNGLKKVKDIIYRPSPATHSHQQPSQRLNFIIMGLILVAMGVMWFKLVNHPVDVHQPHIEPAVSTSRLSIN